MERLTTASSGQDVTACIAYCYQLSQPVSVQAVETQTAVAVQSLLESHIMTETQEEEEEDIFQCGKCKKQYTSLSTFMAHKHAHCLVQHQQQQHQHMPSHQLQQQPLTIQQPQQPMTIQQPHLTLGTGPNHFTSALSPLTGAHSLRSLAGATSISPVTGAHSLRSLGGATSINPLTGTSAISPLTGAPNNSPLIGASAISPLNGATAIGTLTNALGGSLQQNTVNVAVSSINTAAPMIQAHPCVTRTLNQSNQALHQGVVFTDDLMALSSIDTSGLTASTIQMVTGSIQSQGGNNTNSVTIFGPVANISATNNSLSSAATAGAASILVQPGQHITLTSVPDKQHHLTASLPLASSAQPTQQMVQAHMFKPSPTKAGRKSAQNKLVSVLNPDNSVSLLSTRKGKTAKHAKSVMEPAQEDVSAKPKLQCEYCNKEFTKNFDLQQHVRAHTGEKPFQCIVCGRAFAQKSNVKKHMATHKVWPCGTSNTLPKQPEPILLEKDLNLPLTSEPTVSSQAVPTVLSPSELMASNNKHMQVSPSGQDMLKSVTHNNHIQVSPNGQDMLKSVAHKLSSIKSGSQSDSSEEGPKVRVVVDNSYICQYCPTKFKTYYQLKTHLVTHKSEQVYKCVIKKCGHAFHDLDSFLEHVKSHHEEEMSYRCHQCHKYFKSLYELGVHQYSHIYMNQGVKSGPRHFQCTKCGNKYTTPEALEHHTSTTSHSYQCPHCQKQFTCERFLRRHLPIHGSEGQFECPQCQKRFKTEHYLKSHLLIHTGETPFACEICQASFNRKDKLKRHMTIHDSVKKYRCPFRSIAGCIKEFNRPDKLKAHIITHSGIKPFKCPVCNKGFSRRPHLLEHQRGHNYDYRFKCEKCGKGFFRPKLFQEHKCPSSKIGEQHFRPRNRRKIGRPRRRMISIVPDSISSSRGKQYTSRTRRKDTIVQHAARAASEGKQKLKRRQKTSFETSAQAASIENMVNIDNTTSYPEPSTLSVEVVKALPTISSVKTSGVIDIDSSGTMSICISGIEDSKAEMMGESLGTHVQHISLGPGGELLDHYVVHLTESLDGSTPTIQTAFIPAVAGAQIFTSGSQEMGMQPITIIEARPFSLGDCHSKQMMSTSCSNSLVTSHLGQRDSLGQDSMTLSSNYITVASNSHLLNDQLPEVKSEYSETIKLNLSDSNEADSSVIVSSRGELVMMSGAGGSVEVAGSDSCLLSEGDCKEDQVMVISNHGLMVSAGELGASGADVGADMMDGTLSLFSPPASADSYVTSQTYISCPSQLVDYGHAVLQGPS